MASVQATGGAGKSDVSVVVSTRNRPDHIVACVQSILSNSGVEFELVVVDQSDNDESRIAVASNVADPRLRWIASDTRGLSASRNVAIGSTNGPVLAFTDDDCRVPPGWVAAVHSKFSRDVDLGLLFGRVLCLGDDQAGGFAANFDPLIEREFLHRLPDAREPWGIGANMSVRRTVFDRIGTFDPVLGAGAPFHSAEETDLTIRAITAGFKVAYTPDAEVTHLGFRRGGDAARLIRGYGVGFGAALMKHARLGTPGSGRVLADWLAFHTRRSVRNAVRGQRNPGFGLVAAIMWGGVRSLRHAIDPARSIYLR
jgi:GT2 family glycosyltransferase